MIESREPTAEPALSAAQSSNVIDDALKRVEAARPGARAKTLRGEVEALQRTAGVRRWSSKNTYPSQPGFRNTPSIEVSWWRFERLPKGKRIAGGGWSLSLAEAPVGSPSWTTTLSDPRQTWSWFGTSVSLSTRVSDQSSALPNGSEDAPWHIVINGENYHALQALRTTHREQGRPDLHRPALQQRRRRAGSTTTATSIAATATSHSKWLSFIERRLLLALELLKDTGVIIVAIGDEEHHRLRMLLDQVFDPRTSSRTWSGRAAGRTTPGTSPTAPTTCSSTPRT